MGISVATFRTVLAALVIPTIAASGLASSATRPAASGPATSSASLAQMEHPASVVFMLYRKLSFMPTGQVSARLRQEIAHYQAKTHDRQRRVSAKWLGPADFSRGRQAYLADLAEARRIYDGVSRSRRLTPKQERANEQIRKKATARLSVAVRRWPDPLLRKFLLGAAALQMPDYGKAQQMFRSCVQASPQVAGFWQGLAMALSGSGNHCDALAAFSQVLRLRPDSDLAVELIRQAMARVPGTQIRRKEYLDAVELLEMQTERRRRTRRQRGITWLMPGGRWRVRDDFGLPRPAYDRLVFKQAVAVPVARQALLVDEAVVRDAAEVFIRVAEGKFIPVDVREPYDTSGPGVKFAPLLVERYRFRPLKAETDEPLRAGQEVKVFGMSVLAEMGSEVRQFSAEAVELPNGNTPAQIGISRALAPGESAGPVVTSAGELAGFLAGKTDPQAELGGPDRFLPVSELADILRQTRVRTRSYSRRQSATAPFDIKGDHFIVLATFGERLTEDLTTDILAWTTPGR